MGFAKQLDPALKIPPPEIIAIANQKGGVV